MQIEIKFEQDKFWFASVIEQRDVDLFVCGHVCRRFNYIYISGFCNRGTEKGNGAQLLRFAIDNVLRHHRLRRARFKVRLIVDKTSQKLIDYYCKLGFVCRGNIPDFPDEGVVMEAACTASPLLADRLCVTFSE